MAGVNWRLMTPYEMFQEGALPYLETLCLEIASLQLENNRLRNELSHIANERDKQKVLNKSLQRDFEITQQAYRIAKLKQETAEQMLNSKHTSEGQVKILKQVYELQQLVNVAQRHLTRLENEIGCMKIE